MKNKQEYHILPTDELICAILNEELSAADIALDFYDRYIQAMASEPARTSDGGRTGYFYDEDLAQELRLALCRCLPAVRRVLLKQRTGDPVTIIILSESKK